MSKLIVLSNRVSLPNPDKPAAGGLAGLYRMRSRKRVVPGWAGMAKLLATITKLAKQQQNRSLEKL